MELRVKKKKKDKRAVFRVKEIREEFYIKLKPGGTTETSVFVPDILRMGAVFVFQQYGSLKGM